MVRTDRPRKPFRALVADAAVRSVAQLGTRLHALLDPAAPAPAERVERLLRGAGVAAQVALVPASLEDVFVAATGFRRSAGDRPTNAG